MQNKVHLLEAEYSSWQVNAHIYDRDTNTHWALMQSSQESNGWLSYRLCVLEAAARNARMICVGVDRNSDLPAAQMLWILRTIYRH